MLPEIQLGPITLQTFGICFALGFLAAGALVARRLEEIDKPRDWAYEMAFAALVGGLVGSRLDYVLQNWDRASDDLVGTLFGGTGLVWLGGVIGQRVAPLGVDRFGQTGNLADLYGAYRLDGAAITEAVAELLLAPQT